MPTTAVTIPIDADTAYVMVGTHYVDENGHLTARPVELTKGDVIAVSDMYSDDPEIRRVAGGRDL